MPETNWPDEDAYEPDDHKHPAWLSELLDAADWSDE